MSTRSKIVASLLLLLAGGCANVKHLPYKDVEDKDVAKTDVGGFVYYESSPYLLVYPDGKGDIKWQILYLADPTKKHVAKPTATLAKLETTLVFNKGVLTTVNVTADETAVAKAVIGAVKTVVAALAVANQAPPDQLDALRPQIYKIIVKGSEVEFWGAEADKPIVVAM